MKGDYLLKPKPGYGFIYMYIFPDGRIYIGQTIGSVKDRLGYNANGYNKQEKVFGGFITYGLNNIEVKILEECPINMLNEREAFYIEQYNSIEQGFNEYPGCVYTEKHFNKKGRTLSDNCPKQYGNTTVIYTNPTKYPKHLTTVDSCIYKQYLIPENLYVMESTPDDTKLKSFEIRVRINNKNYTLSKYIASKVLNIPIDKVPRVYHKDGNRRNNNLNNLYVYGKPLSAYHV